MAKTTKKVKKTAKKAVKKAKRVAKKAINSEEGKEIIRRERGILGDLLVRIGRKIKKE